LPVPSGVVALIFSPGSLEANVTVSPIAIWLLEFITIAVAVEVDEPFATIDAGDSETDTVFA